MGKRLLFAAALVVAALAGTAQPGPPPLLPGKWWHRPEVIKQLELSPQQQERLDDIFRTAANELIDARGEVEKQQVALRGELERPQIRRKDLQAIAAKLSEARGKLFERELMMLVDMRAVLTDPQWDQLRRHIDNREGRRGPPGGKRP
jgi:Spy/CpxP family protein refolding chaperone